MRAVVVSKGMLSPTSDRSNKLKFVKHSPARYAHIRCQKPTHNNLKPKQQKNNFS